MGKCASSAQQIVIRPVGVDDFPAIAQLLIQLYDFELPGAFSGDVGGQQKLLEFTLSAKGNQGLRGRYVACNEAGEVIATATIELPHQDPYDRAPHGTISQSFALIGYGPTVKLLLAVARNLVPVPRPTTSDVVWFHSLVVDQRFRGQGIARQLMATLEQQAQQQSYQSAWLQVLARNKAACQMYQHLGYQTEWTAPAWQQRLTWPSYLMSKPLISKDRG